MNCCTLDYGFGAGADVHWSQDAAGGEVSGSHMGHTGGIAGGLGLMVVASVLFPKRIRLASTEKQP